MNTNGDESLTNNNGDFESPLLEPSVKQQVYLLQQQLNEAHAQLTKKEKRELDEDAKTNRIAKILKVTLNSHATHKDQKISKRAFCFTQFDGQKIGNIVLS